MVVQRHHGQRSGNRRWVAVDRRKNKKNPEQEVLVQHQVEPQQLADDWALLPRHKRSPTKAQRGPTEVLLSPNIDD